MPWEARERSLSHAHSNKPFKSSPCSSFQECVCVCVRVPRSIRHRQGNDGFPPSLSGISRVPLWDREFRGAAAETAGAPPLLLPPSLSHYFTLLKAKSSCFIFSLWGSVPCRRNLNFIILEAGGGRRRENARKIASRGFPASREAVAESDDAKLANRLAHAG